MPDFWNHFSPYLNQNTIMAIIAVLSLLSLFWRLGPSKSLRYFGTWSAIVMAILLAYSYKIPLNKALSESMERIKSQIFPSYARAITHQSIEVVRALDGHFYLDAIINGVQIHGLIDTGASNVSLTYADAKQLGIPLGALVFNIPTETANGQSLSAAITLDSITVGDRIIVRNIRGLVSKPGDLSVTLLGMSFLNQLHDFNMQDTRLILTGNGDR